MNKYRIVEEELKDNYYKRFHVEEKFLWFWSDCWLAYDTDFPFPTFGSLSEATHAIDNYIKHNNKQKLVTKIIHKYKETKL